MNALLTLKGDGFKGCRINITLPAPYLIADGCIDSRCLEDTPYDALISFDSAAWENVFIETLKLGQGIVVEAVREEVT